MGSHQLALLLFSILASLICLSYSTLPREYSIVGHNFDEIVSEERVVELFQRWKEKHGKVYKHAEEAEKRFMKFKKNLKYVIEKNAGKNNGHVVGLNKFADMSNEEFKETYLRKVKKPVRKGIDGNARRRKVETCEAPSSLDWRKKGIVTQVKDQGECGKLFFLGNAKGTS